MTNEAVMAPVCDTPRSRRPLIKVVVRIRPASDTSSDTCWVKQVNRRTLQTVNHRNVKEFLHYEFEQVYGPETGQALIYEGCARTLVTDVLEGRNACVFAYGPTGSGKTHTMLGSTDDLGIIPRCVTDMFTAIREKAVNRSTIHYQLRFSYLEIYNEKVQDLLMPQQTSVDLPIREDLHHNIFVVGLSEQTINNMEEFTAAFAPAAKNRRTAATSLNKRSSRSHALLMLKVLRVTPSGGTAVVGKVNLIDLAGSEDNRRTGNAGIRLKESSAINTSLLALGQVVEALKNGQSCVPYRASKLTRLLQDSLGGNTQTCMIIAVSPEECHFQETHTTLGFARKAKKIVTSVRPPERRNVYIADHSKREEFPGGVIKPVPFLSPLLREQRKFEGALCKRLERLEQRLLEQMSQSIINQSVVSIVSADTKVNSDNIDKTEDDTLDKMYTVEQSDVTDGSLSDMTCHSHVTSDTSVIAETPSMQYLSRYSSGTASSDIITLSDLSCDRVTDQFDTNTVAMSDSSHGDSRHDFSHVTSGIINFSRGCSDDELTPFSPGGAGTVSGAALINATTTLTTIMREINSCSRGDCDTSIVSKTVSSSSVKMHRMKRKSVFADGSSRIENFLSVDEILSCSPLFLKPPLVKRRRHIPFLSMAASPSSVKALTQARSPLQPINGSSHVTTLGAQREHSVLTAPDDRVLRLLNSGSTKELQSLQTIGLKRAQQIMNWQKLHGQFNEIGDLKKVPGISITKFLSANLID